MLDMEFITMKKSDLVLFSWNLPSKREAGIKKINNYITADIVYRQ